VDAINRRRIEAMLKTTKWDIREELKTREDVLYYLEAALEEDDAEFFLAALGDAARSEGMAQIARETGVTREGLYTSLSAGGNPSLVTIMKVLQVFGFRLRVEQRATA
jgi:probable addiction module antidote protein